MTHLVSKYDHLLAEAKNAPDDDPIWEGREDVYSEILRDLKAREEERYFLVFYAGVSSTHPIFPASTILTAHDGGYPSKVNYPPTPKAMSVFPAPIL